MEAQNRNGRQARYAIYYSPEENSPLDLFGQTWLGRDVRTGAAHPRLQVIRFTDRELAEVVAAAALYGFHATLKAPFFLKSPDQEERLTDTIQTFACRETAFQLPQLVLKRMGRFLALMPEHPCTELNALAERCVRTFDPFRRPAAASEIDRRRAAGLNDKQERYLLKWGYPYVMDEFRFHLTLTGPIHDPGTRRRLTDALSRRITDLDLKSIRVSSVCLFIQEAVGKPFRCHSRYAFGG
jgi:putative phosphonate metabolism protein